MQGHGDTYNRRSEGQPGLWCDWVPCWDGCCLAYNGVEKFYASLEWRGCYAPPTGGTSTIRHCPTSKRWTATYRRDNADGGSAKDRCCPFHPLRCLTPIRRP